MIGRNGKTDGSIKRMLHMMRNGKKIEKNVSEKTVMDVDRGRVSTKRY